MSTEVTSLVLEVDSTQAVGASADLEKLAKAGEHAEAATSIKPNIDSSGLKRASDDADKLASSGDKAQKATDNVSKAAGRARDSLGRFASGAKQAESAEKKLGEEANKADDKVKKLGDEAQKAGAKAKKMGDDAKGAASATKGLGDMFSLGLPSFTAWGAAAGAAAIAVGGLYKAISVQRQFDVLNAGLITATGSAENADVAFQALTDFAKNTPYDLAQVTGSFTKLVNLGLDPSERALKSYGNTASAMGKDMNDLIEAVADAATGEFERLKEFGIKAKSEGDKVSLTFRGVTTTIGKNASEIESYLIKLGENEFAGAMERRMDSLDGKLSNVADEFDAMFRNIMASDFGTGVENMVDLALVALGEINDYLASGQFEGHLEAMGAAWGPWVDDAKEATFIIMGAIDDLQNWMDTSAPGLEEALISPWRDFPENVRAQIQIAASYLAAFVEQVGIDVRAITGYFDALKDGWGGRTILQNLQEFATASNNNRHTLQATIGDILEERRATIDATKTALDGAAARRAAYEKERAAREAARKEDRLARFRTGADGKDSASDSAGKKAQDKAAKALEQLREQLATEEETIAASYAKREAIIAAATRKGSDEQIQLSARSLALRDKELKELADKKGREVEQIRLSLRTEEQEIQESYERRMAIVDASTTLSEEARQRLREKLSEERNKDLAELASSEQAKRDSLWQGLLTEEEEIRLSHERRRQIILEATGITEKERQDLLRREEAKFMKESADRERQRIAMITGSAGDMFGALGQLIATYAQTSDKHGKRMFKVAQAFSIAQAVISIATGIAKAQELGYPMNIMESIRVAAVGAAQIATIKSQKYAGEYDQGGQIPAGKWGWVGENGRERVRGPVTVTGRKTSERYAGGSGGDINVKTEVHIHSDGTVSEKTSAGSDNQDAEVLGRLVSAKVREELVAQQRTGGILWRMQHG